MHRPTLVIRRFGELSFGLGYVEDGVWVDHADVIAREGRWGLSTAELDALDAIHTWFDCCAEPAATIPIALDAPVVASLRT
jgi:hypothetical protein